MSDASSGAEKDSLSEKDPLVIGDSSNDQFYFEEIRKRKGVNIAWLPHELFKCGLHYKQSEVLKNDNGNFVHAVSKEKVIYSNRRIQVTTLRQPVVILNNWIVGNSAKTARANRHGQWFLSGDGQRCEEPPESLALAYKTLDFSTMNEVPLLVVVLLLVFILPLRR